MRKEAILAIILLTIVILLFLGSFVIAQKNNESIEQENSLKESFIQYLQEKIDGLSEEEKEQFEGYQKTEPTELFFKAMEKVPSQN